MDVIAANIQRVTSRLLLAFLCVLWVLWKSEQARPLEYAILFGAYTLGYLLTKIFSKNGNTNGVDSWGKGGG